MPNTRKYFLLTAIISFFFALLIYKQTMAMSMRPKTKTDEATTSSNIIKEEAKKNVAKPVQITKFCPQAEELIKKDDMWATRDDKWKNFTPSSATKVLNFLGAQWVGIKVGKIICLYLTNEAVAFPLAVEQTSSELIAEPAKFGWSSLVNNRKFCKSVSTADCPYFIQAQEDNSDPYKEIEYKPRTN